jgi:hypothetical protein
MRILLTESDRGAADTAATTLEHAGHQVVRCSHPDEAAFPCRGLHAGDCPLDDQVDVALAVRAEDRPSPTEREAGITCALRQRIPLVVAGRGDDPFATWEASAVEGADPAELLSALTDAAEGELPAHAAVAAREVASRLGTEPVRADARRHANGVVVTVTPSVALEPAARETLGIQVAAAVRRFDRWIGIIDVNVA